MGIFQADAVIKESIMLGLEDMRANLWLLDYLMEDFTKNPYLAQKYGQKQIDSAKEWFKNNNIEVVLGYRSDKMKTPCVSIILEPQNEKNDMKHMGDSSTESVILLPTQIGKPIPYVIKPFVPTGYDQQNGIVGIDPETKGLDATVAGMILVNPANGNGYIITDVDGDGIHIEAGLELDATQLAVVPQFQYYQARVEHTFMQASYSIICTAHGDPQQALWLHDIVLYSLFRYRESLLEALGLGESTINSGALVTNADMPGNGGEVAWERAISISGQIEQTFIKSPRRFIESVVLKRRRKNGGQVGGISIISNTYPQFEDESKVNWYPDTIEQVNAEAAEDEES